MKEIVTDFVDYQNPESSEHSAYAKSKKVISGPLVVPAGIAPNDNRTINPIHASIGTELALVQGKAYRLVASAAVYYRQASETGSVAAIGDIYLPANTPVVISSVKFPFVANIAVSGGGIIQAVEVL